MNKDLVIRILAENNYSFKEKDNQIIVKLGLRCFYVINFEGENIGSCQDIINNFGVFKNKSLKFEIMNNIIGFIFCFLFTILINIALGRSFNAINSYFPFIIIGMLFCFGELIYYQMRLSVLKKRLNFNHELAA